jgi:mannose-1-phosphate guanylyltransferase
MTSRQQEPVARAQLAALPHLEGNDVHVLGEPVARNTAAAIGLAAVHLQRQDPEAVMVVLPADHWIERRQAFVELVHGATHLAQEGSLVTLGIVPDRAETGYGYIRRGESFSSAHSSLINGQVAYRVAQFVEKPDLHTAQHYLDTGMYYWNGGIFIWRAATI